MLNIYFTAAMSFNGQLHDNYIKIIELLKKDQKLLSGDQIVLQDLKNQDKHLSKKEIFERQRGLIDGADLIVAEVTRPSLGVGSEIEYAIQKKKPVLALVFKNADDMLSPMIAGDPSAYLYIEHYDLDNLHLVLKNFFSFIKKQISKKGKLIVIDGGDGSGKTTQAKLLLDYLQSKRIPVKYMDFPRYYSSFHGQTVARFLRGEFGKLGEVSPYLASLAYALDRASCKEEMDDFLQSGGVIIANRYATSNMAHQGAKFDNEKEKSEFLKWVLELEYKVHKIPKEDMVIYLYVPSQIATSLSEQKNNQAYLNGSSDIHEVDRAYRQKVEDMYLTLARKYKQWVKINCVENNKILPVSTIQEKIKDVIDKQFRLF